MFRAFLAFFLAFAATLAAQQPQLTEDQIRAFLLKADVVAQKQTKKGVTNPWQLTLRHGDLTHTALFQAINERKDRMVFSNGRVEMNFRDSYHYNIAAYEVAKLLGLDDAVPVAVARKWRGSTGAAVWWIQAKMDEGDRLRLKLDPPDHDAWNRQLYRLRVFTELLYDTDPNLGNWLITEDWKVWRVDFTRAFRLHQEIQTPKNLVKCERQLLEKLRRLDETQVAQHTKPHLTKEEVKALMARRDRILAHFEKLIAERGESEVLY